MAQELRFDIRPIRFAAVLFILAVSLAAAIPNARAAAEREPVSMNVVVANPSKEKTHVIPVKIDLPSEVKPDDILEKGDLEVVYDDQRSIYFLFNGEVTLKPQETRVFNVLVRNVWFIPQQELDELKTYTGLLMERLKGSEYETAGQRLADIIYQKLEAIDARQKDETVGQKQKIGLYRINLQTVAEIKEHLTKLEKIMSFQGGPPVPEMLQESKLKSDSPSTKTTWLIVFSIIVFLALMAAQFFFTWHRRSVSEKDFQSAQKQKLPGSAPPSGYGPSGTGADRKTA